MINKRFKTISSLILSFGLCVALISKTSFASYATETEGSIPADAQQETAASAGWPQGPDVSATAAILMEANTGTILYAKNIHEQLYPASTTKVLTALIAMEECDMDEVVEYSSEAVNSINWREDSNIGIKPGEAITMEQSLYGLMVGSGNECGNAIGEHISGSIEGFVEKMNQRAQELGCTDSHFVTTNGIHDENHYTSAHDLAVIAQQYFSHDLLCKMSNTLDYVIPASATLSQELIPYTKNRLLAGRQYAYEGLVGSKTGYTSQAQQNLVSCAERDGMKLICVVMKDSSPEQFTDTVDLFNFGFSNFQTVNVAENDTKYTVQSSGFFESAQDIFGSFSPLLSLDQDAYIVLPNNVSLEEAESTLDYEGLAEGQAAMIHYTYNGQPIGEAPVLLTTAANTFDFDKEDTAAEAVDAPGVQNSAAASDPSLETAEAASLSDSQTAESEAVSDGNSPQENTVFLNVNKMLLWVGGIAGLVILILIIHSAIRNYTLSKRRKAIMKRRRERSKEIIDFDKYTDSSL